MSQQRVLFICTHNSARSQMAEGMLRVMGGDEFDVFSAGLEAGHLRPEAVAVMDEVGIDISGQESKSLERYFQEPFDWLITVCDYSRQHCPIFPGVDQTMHWGVDDPAEVEGSEEVRLRAFRSARDDLRNRIRLFITTARRPDTVHPMETLGA